MDIVNEIFFYVFVIFIDTFTSINFGCSLVSAMQSLQLISSYYFISFIIWIWNNEPDNGSIIENTQSFSLH